jgi:hypothetical protein
MVLESETVFRHARLDNVAFRAQLAMRPFTSEMSTPRGLPLLGKLSRPKASPAISRHDRCIPIQINNRDPSFSEVAGYGFASNRPALSKR